jgi:predicted MPP superfamily phosphohydrolase
LQLSDLHLNKFRWQHEKLTKEIHDKNPDVIFFTGDSIEKSGKLAELEKLLASLPKRTPKFAILGNWEYWSGENL